jgi:hypothetical protein
MVIQGVKGGKSCDLVHTGNISTIPALFGSNAPKNGRETTYNVKPVHRKWKLAKLVCISLKAGSSKMALLVKTIPIVASMLIAVHIRNCFLALEDGFAGIFAGTGSDSYFLSSACACASISRSSRGMEFSLELASGIM